MTLALLTLAGLIAFAIGAGLLVARIERGAERLLTTLNTKGDER